MDSTYRVGYALFLIPSQLVLADGRIPARIWLPALECAWGVCVGLMACMKSATGIYVLRFFIGVFGRSFTFALTGVARQR
jgi:ACS family tartrate transporter-like MFS transporter